MNHKRATWGHEGQEEYKQLMIAIGAKFTSDWLRDWHKNFITNHKRVGSQSKM